MPRPRLNEADRHRLTRWWAAQVSDPEIARRLGCDPTVVCRMRRKLGLKSWYGTRYHGVASPATRDKARSVVRARLAAAGVTNLSQLSHEPRGTKARRQLASRYGLPADLHKMETRIVVALANGPLDLGQLLDVLGKRRWRSPDLIRAFSYRKVAGGNYIVSLIRRGFVVRVRTTRGLGAGSGQGPGVYLLTPFAMNMLSSIHPQE